jgi:hypothetical protein
MIYKISVDENNEKAMSIINMLTALSKDSDFMELEKVDDAPKIPGDVLLMLEQRSREVEEHPETLMDWDEYEKRF